MYCIYKEGKYIYSCKKTRYVKLDITNGKFYNNKDEEVSLSLAKNYFKLSFFNNYDNIKNMKDPYFKFIYFILQKYRNRGLSEVIDMMSDGVWSGNMYTELSTNGALMAILSEIHKFKSTEQILSMLLRLNYDFRDLTSTYPAYTPRTIFSEVATAIRFLKNLQNHYHESSRYGDYINLHKTTITEEKILNSIKHMELFLKILKSTSPRRTYSLHQMLDNNLKNIMYLSLTESKFMDILTKHPLSCYFTNIFVEIECSSELECFTFYTPLGSKLKQILGVENTFNNLEKINNYLMRYVQYEGLDAKTITDSLVDYWDILKKLNIEVDSIDKIFPKHLLSTERKYVKQLEDFKEFEKMNIQLNKNNHFECSINNFTFKLPENYKELQDEGNQQSNCVSSYFDRIKEDKCSIVFMRKITDKDTSYITIEIDNKDKTIVQAKRIRNRGISKADLNIINKFAEKNNLEVAKWL